MYVLDSDDGSTVPYDTEFKKYVSITYKEIKLGKVHE